MTHDRPAERDDPRASRPPGDAPARPRASKEADGGPTSRCETRRDTVGMPCVSKRPGEDPTRPRQSKDAGGAACHLLSRTSSPRTARSSRSREVADVVIVSKTRLEGEVNAATTMVDAVVMVATAAERAKAESFMIVGYE